MKQWIAFILLLSMFLVMPVHAQAESTLSNAGMGIATILATCLYSPAKVIYAVSGAIAGGAAYLLTGINKNVANAVWIPSLRGTYVLTPDMLRGKEEVQFMGHSAE